MWVTPELSADCWWIWPVSRRSKSDLVLVSPRLRLLFLKARDRSSTPPLAPNVEKQTLFSPYIKSTKSAWYWYRYWDLGHRLWYEFVLCPLYHCTNTLHSYSKPLSWRSWNWFESYSTAIVCKAPPQRGSIALTDFQPVFLLTAGLRWMMQKMIGRLPKSLTSFTDDYYSLPLVAQQKPSRMPTMLSLREAIWKCKKFILNSILSMIVPKAQL